MSRLDVSFPERFWSKVAFGDWLDCWPWTAFIHQGYGRFQLDGRSAGAHRVAYELLVGPIPGDLQIDHLCRVKHCVNPLHLEVVTVQENLRRRVLVPKTHCQRGHPFDDENTYVDRDGWRRCRPCARANLYAWRKAHR